MRWHFVLPIMALVIATKFPSSLFFHIGPVWFSPVRCTLLGAMLVYAFGFALHRHILFAWAACMCFGAAGIGLSVRQILDSFNQITGVFFLVMIVLSSVEIYANFRARSP